MVMYKRVSGHPQMIKIKRGSVTLEISDTLSRKCDRECDKVMEFSVTSPGDKFSRDIAILA